MTRGHVAFFLVRETSQGDTRMTSIREINGNFRKDGRRKGCCLQVNRWHALSAAMILMGCGGLTYTYAVYSEHIKGKLHYTQEQIDNIGAAKDFGAFLGLISGFLYNFYPPWVTVYIGALMHLLGYGLVWMIMDGRTTTSIWMLCLYIAFGTGGDNWVDTACMMTSLQNFEDHRGTAMGILKSQLGLSGAMFVTIYDAFLQPDVNKFIFMVAVAPTVLCLLLGFLISPFTPNERDKDIRDTVSRFRTIYGMTLLLGLFLTLSMIIRVRIHPGKQASNVFAILMLVIISITCTVPMLRKPFSFLRCVSSSGKPPVEDIDLVPIPVPSVNHKKFLDRKTELTNEDCEMETFPLKRIPGLNEEEEPAEMSGLSNIKEHDEVQSATELTVRECLFGIDFWLVNFVVISGAGSGLAIINNFAQIGKAAESKEIDLYVGIISVGSCFGRITSGYGSDFLMRNGYPRPLCLFVTQITMTISCILLAIGEVPFLYIGSAFVGIAYGAYWTLSPAVLSEVFGLKPFTILYKIIGIAPTVGSYILSAKVLGALYDKQTVLYNNSSTKSIEHDEENTCYGWKCFGFALLYLSVICLIGAVSCLWLLQRTQRLYNRKCRLVYSPIN